MRIISLTIIFLGIFSFSQAQIIQQNSAPSAQLPVLPDSMSYEEFEMLTRSINWQRLMIASFVPGYIHFYAHHKKIGYGIAGIRSFGFILSTAEILKQWHETKRIDFKFITDMETKFYLFIAGFVLNVGGYFFDIAHGDWLIAQERTRIQFKYRKLQSPCCAGIFNESIPTIGLSVQF